MESYVEIDVIPAHPTVIGWCAFDLAQYCCQRSKSVGVEVSTLSPDTARNPGPHVVA